MNAPYDGDRGQGAGDPAQGGDAPPGPPYSGQPPHHQGQPPQPPAPDAYLQDAYDQDPYRSQDLSAQDPVTEALYDRSAHPPPPPGTYQETQPLYAPPAASQYPPDPRIWAQTPPPEPDGPSRHLPYADDPRTVQFVGVDDLVTHSGEERREPDAFAHLFKDQQAGGGPQAAAGVLAPTPEPQQAPVPPKSSSRAAGLLKSSALMAAGTIVSRLTGFLRTLVIAAAIGVGTLNDTYQVANTLPTMIYVLVGGGALNAVFIPQLVRAMKSDDDGGEAYANRLLTLVVTLMAAVTTICVLCAPFLIWMMSPKIASDPQRLDVAVAFARYCLPTMFFMGVHIVLGQILNARGRFGAMMWTPVLNNIVIIATFGAFIWVFGGYTDSGVSASNVTPEGVRLLGIGTLLGLVVQALAMVPYLRDAGFRMRLRFDWRGHGLGKALGLAKWTFFFVLANQLGMIIVTQLATWAGSVAEKQGHTGTGITAYNYALLLWQMPQAIITVSVMTAVLPRISRSAVDGDAAAVRDDISYGLRTSAVAIVPCAFAFLALGVPMTTLLYAGSGEAGARSIGYILMAFGLGLIPYSVQYVVLRGFYAYEDTRTPFYNTVIVAAVNAAASGLSFVLLPAQWAVVGMAASYGLAYVFGVGVAWRRLRKLLGGDLDGAHVLRTYARLIGASVPAALVGGGVAFALTRALGSGAGGSLVALVVGGIVLLGVFYVAARRMRVAELNSMIGMVRGRLGR
ncbi:murein biosynthesis integral membrane protein MurJ [Streptomyces tsukubensis]|uniref:Murein biosynthesis integral membrane protein MurJ n=1 Tax=Streptomyces tsukubensis TaxID=83656 RepID=A0A1V4A9I8_9ACTN|nr:murein biosynthesis integral membrane protein MurJ [Streptomyces tsukubensis]OON79262.1 murein biosynthesis integral membrane protein MurJ [Streptomyces tsukubensis]QFR94618.1 murein biosynthesis integral membrane protein MurJ [Streptomyces tsukubensis]